MSPSAGLQVRGPGGSDELARAVAATRLGGDYDNDAFWISVIHLLRNTTRLDLAQVEPIIEYLHNQKFEAQPVIIGEDTEVYLGSAPTRPLCQGPHRWPHYGGKWPTGKPSGVRISPNGG